MAANPPSSLDELSVWACFRSLESGRYEEDFSVSLKDFCGGYNSSRRDMAVERLLVAMALDQWNAGGGKGDQEALCQHYRHHRSKIELMLSRFIAEQGSSSRIEENEDSDDDSDATLPDGVDDSDATLPDDFEGHMFRNKILMGVGQSTEKMEKIRAEIEKGDKNNLGHSEDDTNSENTEGESTCSFEKYSASPRNQNESSTPNEGQGKTKYKVRSFECDGKERAGEKRGPEENNQAKLNGDAEETSLSDLDHHESAKKRSEEVFGRPFHQLMLRPSEMPKGNEDEYDEPVPLEYLQSHISLLDGPTLADCPPVSTTPSHVIHSKNNYKSSSPTASTPPPRRISQSPSVCLDDYSISFHSEKDVDSSSHANDPTPSQEAHDLAERCGEVTVDPASANKSFVEETQDDEDESDSGESAIDRETNDKAEEVVISTNCAGVNLENSIENDLNVKSKLARVHRTLQISDNMKIGVADIIGPRVRKKTNRFGYSEDEEKGNKNKIIEAPANPRERIKKARKGRSKSTSDQDLSSLDNVAVNGAPEEPNSTVNLSIEDAKNMTKDAIMESLPSSMKNRFGQICFAPWQGIKLMVLIINPFDVLPGSKERSEWMREYVAARQRNFVSPRFLIYWYGSSDAPQYSMISSANLIDLKAGIRQKFHWIPSKVRSMYEEHRFLQDARRFQISGPPEAMMDLRKSSLSDRRGNILPLSEQLNRLKDSERFKGAKRYESDGEDSLASAEERLQKTLEVSKPSKADKKKRRHNIGQKVLLVDKSGTVDIDESAHVWNMERDTSQNMRLRGPDRPRLNTYVIDVTDQDGNETKIPSTPIVPKIPAKPNGGSTSPTIFEETRVCLYQNIKTRFEKNQAKIIAELPPSITSRFGDMCLWQSSDGPLPALIMNPFFVPPGLLQRNWFQNYFARLKRGTLGNMPQLVYWYGSSAKFSLEKDLSAFESCNREKMISSSLSQPIHDFDPEVALEEMDQDFQKEPWERRGYFIPFQQPHKLGCKLHFCPVDMTSMVLGTPPLHSVEICGCSFVLSGVASSQYNARAKRAPATSKRKRKEPHRFASIDFSSLRTKADKSKASSTVQAPDKPRLVNFAKKKERRHKRAKPSHFQDLSAQRFVVSTAILPSKRKNSTRATIRNHELSLLPANDSERNSDKDKSRNNANTKSSNDNNFHGSDCEDHSSSSFATSSVGNDKDGSGYGNTLEMDVATKCKDKKEALPKWLKEGNVEECRTNQPFGVNYLVGVLGQSCEWSLAIARVLEREVNKQKKGNYWVAIRDVSARLKETDLNTLKAIQTKEALLKRLFL